MKIISGRHSAQTKPEIKTFSSTVCVHFFKHNSLWSFLWNSSEEIKKSGLETSCCLDSTMQTEYRCLRLNYPSYVPSIKCFALLQSKYTCAPRHRHKHKCDPNLQICRSSAKQCGNTACYAHFAFDWPLQQTTQNYSMILYL